MSLVNESSGSISGGIPTREGARQGDRDGMTVDSGVNTPSPREATPSLDLAWNWPNAITLVRGIGSVAIGMLAIDRGSVALLVIAYAVYWIGDAADGQVARRRGRETRFGAVFDILTDRLSTAIVSLGLLQHMPDLWPAVAVFLVNFMVVDCMLSVSFLMWPLVSPNYFGAVNRRVYLLNWSHPAKAINNAGIVAALLVGNMWLALGFATAMLGLKLWSAREVANLLRAREAAA